MIPRIIVNVNDYYDNDCARFHTIKIENLKIIGDLMAITVKSLLVPAGTNFSESLVLRVQFEGGLN